MGLDCLANTFLVRSFLINALFSAKLISIVSLGRNTTLTIRPHDNSLPSMPFLSRVLASFEVTIPTPRFGGVGAPDDHRPSLFIESATVSSLLPYSTLYSGH